MRFLKVRHRRLEAVSRHGWHGRWAVASLTALVLHGAAAATVLAQEPARIPGEGGGALPWAIGLGLMLVVSLTGFLNPKRSHQS